VTGYGWPGSSLVVYSGISDIHEDSLAASSGLAGCFALLMRQGSFFMRTINTTVLHACPNTEVSQVRSIVPVAEMPSGISIILVRR
jgi:hypothetical protein